ncbi:MAG: LPS assembly lipoprotein LptE [Arenicellales bacterium]
MHLFKRSIILFILAASLFSAGCGFHLRGKINVPDSLLRMHIAGNDVELIEKVGDALAFSSVAIVDEADGVAVLDMSKTTYEKEVNATNGNGIATSYKLNYTVDYDIIDAQENSVQKHQLSQSRVLAYDVANILLFEREEAFLKEDMQKELVSAMLRRISRIK